MKNLPIRDVIDQRISRRSLLSGMAAGAIVATAPAFAVVTENLNNSSLGFEDIAHGIDDKDHVAKGYSKDVLIRWGDPLHDGTPAFDALKISASAQERQFGYNCDFVAFLPLPQGSQNSSHGLLCVNHEYAIPSLMYGENISEARVAAELASHGHSVVEIKKTGGKWGVVQGGDYNRRITGKTLCTVSGPAAGHARLKTSADPQGAEIEGTLANCSGGVTPWGTVLSGEENFPHHFNGTGATAEAANYKRLGLPDDKFNWRKYHARFDMDKEPMEPNRFGWVVEIDPYDPKKPPVKRTALGRCRHEAATSVVNKDGRVVVYMGDDSKFEYIYKFVTEKKFNPHDRAANMDLLDSGTLYAAKFLDDGTLSWLPLVHGQGGLTKENGFNDQGDVLIDLRRAGDTIGATPMDRPEDVEPDPVSGRVYAVMTNNNERAFYNTDKANPRRTNDEGHIIEMIPPGGAGKDADHAAEEYTWEFFLLAGNPAEGRALYGKAAPGENGWLACPDNVAFDGKGRIWIATDQGSKQSVFKTGDGLYAADTTGGGRAQTKFFYRVPVGAELCGPCFTPDCKTLFVAVQHPGEDSTFANPSTRWPDFKDGVPPRPSIVAITKDDGGEIGG